MNLIGHSGTTDCCSRIWPSVHCPELKANHVQLRREIHSIGWATRGEKLKDTMALRQNQWNIECCWWIEQMSQVQDNSCHPWFSESASHKTTGKQNINLPLQQELMIRRWAPYKEERVSITHKAISVISGKNWMEWDLRYSEPIPTVPKAKGLSSLASREQNKKELLSTTTALTQRYHSHTTDNIGIR